MLTSAGDGVIKLWALKNIAKVFKLRQVMRQHTAAITSM